MPIKQARSHGVVCGGKATPGQMDGNWMASFCPPEDFLAIVYCSFIIVAAKERSPKILVKINLGLCNIQENSIFSCIHFIYLIVIA